MNKSYLILILLTGWLSSCESKEEALLKNPVQIDQYFPISQFVNEQISLLDGRSVSKQVVMNGESHQVEQVLYERDWREEFDWFIQSDINKASLAGAYHTEEIGNTTRHTLKPGEKGVLQQLEVIYEGSQVKEIRMLSSRENTFYASNASSIITTGEDGLISTYHIESTQKVWFLNPNNLTVTGEIKADQSL
jgi:hypothetical protein